MGGPSLPDGVIPLRVSSKIQNMPAYKAEAENLKRRKISNSSRFSSSASVSEFITIKVDNANADLAHLAALYDIAENALQKQTLNKDDYHDLVKNIDSKRETVESEIHVVKKQRKFVQDDLEDLVAGNVLDDLERTHDQYARIIVKCVEGASQNFRSPEIKGKTFRNLVCARLMARKVIGKDKSGHRIRMVWCHVLGDWFDPDDVATAHLVPKSLAGEEISYAFGVENLSMMDPALGKFVKLYINYKPDFYF
jgi:hypothetical protein